jgi:hypothetical protein
MSDGIVDVSGQDARMLALQFMGQQMGDLKQIDKNIVSRNPTLQGLTLNPEKIINDIPVYNNPQPVVVPTSAPLPSLPVQFHTTDTQQTIQPTIQPIIQTVVQPKDNSNQLELNFTYDIAKDMVDRLDRVEKLLKKVLSELAAAKQPAEEITKPLKKT